LTNSIEMSSDKGQFDCIAIWNLEAQCLIV